MFKPLANLLAEILDLRDQLGSPIRNLVRPPLPPSEVSTLFLQAGIHPPRVLLDLYATMDGLEPGVRFIEGKRLLPLQAAVASYTIWRPILGEYGYSPLFPIAEDEFGAGYGVLLNDPSEDPPVMSLPLQCGVDQFYDSVTLMFATLAARMRAGLKSVYDVEEDELADLDLYLAIGRDLNPKSCYRRTA